MCIAAAGSSLQASKAQAEEPQQNLQAGDKREQMQKIY